MLLSEGCHPLLTPLVEANSTLAYSIVSFIPNDHLFFSIAWYQNAVKRSNSSRETSVDISTPKVHVTNEN
jgi:hypothetical protein